MNHRIDWLDPDDEWNFLNDAAGWIVCMAAGAIGLIAAAVMKFAPIDQGGHMDLGWVLLVFIPSLLVFLAPALWKWASTFHADYGLDYYRRSLFSLYEASNDDVKSEVKITNKILRSMSDAEVENSLRAFRKIQMEKENQENLLGYKKPTVGSRISDALEERAQHISAVNDELRKRRDAAPDQVV